jgi:hypothetical protein
MLRGFECGEKSFSQARKYLPNPKKVLNINRAFYILCKEVFTLFPPKLYAGK